MSMPWVQENVSLDPRWVGNLLDSCVWLWALYQGDWHIEGDQRAASEVMSWPGSRAWEKRNWDSFRGKTGRQDLIFRYQKNSEALQAKSWQRLGRMNKERNLIPA